MTPLPNGKGRRYCLGSYSCGSLTRPNHARRCWTGLESGIRTQMALHRNRVEPFLIPVVILVVFIQLGFLVGAARGALLGGADFRHLYTAGYMVRAGQGSEIYDFS